MILEVLNILRLVLLFIIIIFLLAAFIAFISEFSDLLSRGSQTIRDKFLTSLSMFIVFIMLYLGAATIINYIFSFSKYLPITSEYEEIYTYESIPRIYDIEIDTEFINVDNKLYFVKLINNKFNKEDELKKVVYEEEEILYLNGDILE